MDEILAYNREDLEATWAVMEWLRTTAGVGTAESRTPGANLSRG